MMSDSQKRGVDPQKTGVITQKVASDTQKVGYRAPKKLTTGRWMCRKCLNYVPPEAKVCHCGGESFTLEFDPKALSEALRRDAERVKSRLERVNPP